jgi:hypothetical protein
MIPIACDPELAPDAVRTEARIVRTALAPWRGIEIQGVSLPFTNECSASVHANRW